MLAWRLIFLKNMKFTIDIITFIGYNVYRKEVRDTEEAIIVISLVTAVINLATALLMYKASKK